MTKQITTYTANVTGISASNVISSASEITARQNTSTAINNTGEVVAENRALLEAIHTTDHIVNVISTSFTGGTNELAILANAITWWDQSVYTADKTAAALLTGWPAKTITGLTTSNTFYIWATFVSGTKDYEATNITAALPSNLTEKALIGIATVSGAGAVTFAINWQGPVQTRENYFRDAQYFLNSVNIKGNATFQGNITASSNTNTVYALPTNYHDIRIDYTDANTITLLSGSRCRSSDDTTDIIFSTDRTCVLNASGANGLDTGSEASNTWYYLYAIYNPTTLTSALLFSTVNETVTGSITLPSGYTKKRQLKFAVRNDASSNILSFKYHNNNRIIYGVANDLVSSTFTTAVLAGGSSTTFADVSCASYVPPISRGAYIQALSGLGTLIVKAKGRTDVGNNYSGFAAETTNCLPPMWLDLDSSQIFQYRRTANSSTIWIYGFEVTEVK